MIEAEDAPRSKDGIDEMACTGVIPTTEERTYGEEDEVTRVLRWRMNQLVHGGFSPLKATELAVRLDVNLHEALALVEDGCPPETAARILL
jgi:hypothetical protein